MHFTDVPVMIYNKKPSTHPTPAQNAAHEHFNDALNPFLPLRLSIESPELIKSINYRYDNLHILAHKIYIKSLRSVHKRLDPDVDYSELNSSQLYPFLSFSIDGTLTVHIDTKGEIVASFEPFKRFK